MTGRTLGDAGTYVPVSPPTSFTADVFTDIVLERHRQIHLYGHNENTPDGTGPDVRWLGDLGTIPTAEMPARLLEAMLRSDYNAHSRSEQPLTWMHFLREEFAEAMQEEDPAKLYTELIQVAAVAVSWAEKLRQR